MGVSIRILHVDDDPQFADLATNFLAKESADFDYVSETHASDALERLLEPDVEFDCVVSDYSLPGMDGLEFLAAVRAEHPDLPFILFTGKGSEEVARDALVGGATDYLQKQSGTEQWGLLANRIRNAVEQYHNKREQESSERYRRRLYEITSDTELQFEEKIDRLLELGCERLGVENGHVVRIDRQMGRHEIRMAAGSDFVQPDTVTELEETYCRRTITVDDILAVYNAPREGWEDDPAYRRWGIGCYIGGRITVGEDLYGTLCFVNQEPRHREFTSAERGFVDLVTRWLSHMFERQEYERALREVELVFVLQWSAHGSERHEHERGLDVFEQVFNAMPDGVFVLDSDLEFTMVNDAMTEISEYSREEVVGSHASRIFEEGVIELDHREFELLETEILTSGGDTIPCELMGSSLPDTEAPDDRRTVGVLSNSSETSVID